MKFNLTLSCTTAGAEIHYTRNGAEPTLSDPWVVSGGTISITMDCTVKAKAFTASESSTTTSASYLLTGGVSGGGAHAYALGTSGKVWSWGQQQYGRLANGLSASATISSPVAAKYSASILMDDVSMVEAGVTHAIFLKSNGDVYGVGRNSRGQVGNYSSTDVSYPVRAVKSTTASDYLTGCIAVDAGDEFSLALGSNGKVYAWGDREYRKLGDNDPDGYRSYAQTVTTDATGNPELIGIVAISANRYSSVAREANGIETPGALGRVWGWGNNTYKQIGSGSNENKGRASLIMLDSSTVLTDAWDASSGGRHSAILRWKTGDSTLQGSVWCVGSQNYGRLGNNQTSNTNLQYPVQVVKSGGAQLNGIIAVSASETHTLALEQPVAGQVGGKVWSWGYNGSGELGDGSSTNNRGYAATVKTLNSSNAVVDLDNIVKVSAGGDGTNDYSMAIAADGSIYTWGANALGQLGLGSTSTATPWLAKKVPNLKLRATAPTVTMGLALPYLNRPGMNVTLFASPADANGAEDVTKVEFFNGSTFLGTVSASPWTYDFTNLPAGDYVIKAKATDSTGLTGESNVVSFTVLAAIAPQVTLTSTIVAPGKVNFFVTPTDANGADDIVKVEYFEGTTKRWESTAPPWSIGVDNLAAGNYSIHAVVTDAEGLTGQSTPTTFVIKGAPSVSLSAVTPNPNSPGASVTLNAAPSDPNGSADITKVEFFNNTTKIGESLGSPWSFAYPNLAAGNYSVRAVVTDSTALTGQSSTVSFTILPATAPQVTLSHTVVKNEDPGSVILSASPADANGSGDIVKVEFFQGSTKVGTALSAPWAYPLNNLAEGNYQIHAKVTDQAGLTAESANVSFTIAPMPLSITLEAEPPDINAPGSAVILKSFPVTPNGDAGLSKVEFFNNGTKIGESLSSPWSYSYPGLSAGNYSVHAVVTDIAGRTSQSAAVVFTILPHSNPSVSLGIVVTTPETPGEAVFNTIPFDQNGPSDIAKVEYFNGSIKVGEATDPPWSYHYQNLLPASYSIQAVVTDHSGRTGQSNVVPFKISIVAPTLEITQTTASTVSLIWDNVENESGYRIERSTDKVNFSVLGTVEANVTSYGDSSLSQNTAYYYRVIASHLQLESGPSNVVVATTSYLPPTAPVSVSVSNVSAQRFLVAWSPSSLNQAYYVVQISSNNGTDWKDAVQVANTLSSADVKNILEKTSYLVRVVAVNPTGSAYSSPVAVTTPALPPSSPQNLVIVSATPTSSVIAWQDAATNETGYLVEKSEDAGATWSTAATLAASTITVTVDSLVETKGYKFKVTALNGSTYSAPSNVVSLPALPLAPTTVVASALEWNAIKITWSLPADTAREAVRIQGLLTGTTTFGVITQLADGTTSHTDFSLTEDTSYRYQVSAVNVRGEASAWSNAVSTLHKFPVPPVVTATVLGARSVRIDWTDNSNNETGFIVKRATSFSGPWNPVANLAVSSTTFTDSSGLTGSTHYYYKVTVTGTEDSADSNVVDVFTSVPLPNHAPDVLSIFPAGAMSRGYSTSISGATRFSARNYERIGNYWLRSLTQQGADGNTAEVISDPSTGAQIAPVIPSPKTFDSENFGETVAYSKGRIFIPAYGARKDLANASSPKCGAVYVFSWAQENGSQQWVAKQIARIVPPDGQAQDKFGYRISADGDRILIGAPGADGGIGRAYLFDLPSTPIATSDNWNLKRIVRPTRLESGENFGTAVALKGTKFIVGAPYEDGSISVSGGAPVTIPNIGAIYFGEWNSEGVTSFANPLMIDAFPQGLQAVNALANSYLGYSLTMSSSLEITVFAPGYFLSNQQTGCGYTYLWNGRLDSLARIVPSRLPLPSDPTKELGYFSKMDLNNGYVHFLSNINSPSSRILFTSLVGFPGQRCGDLTGYDSDSDPLSYSVIAGNLNEFFDLGTYGHVVNAGSESFEIKKDTNGNWGLYSKSALIPNKCYYVGVRMADDTGDYKDTYCYVLILSPPSSNVPVDSTTDSDNDGIPNSWEIAHDMNSYDASDASQSLGGDGLTAKQKYLNYLAGKTYGIDPRKWDLDPSGDEDGDGVINKEDAAPFDPSIGKFSMKIIQPVSGASY